MKRCFYLTCEGEKQGHIISKDEHFTNVRTLEGKEIILKNWKVKEVDF